MSFYTNVQRYGSTILYRGYNENGVAVSKRVKFEPTLFVPSPGTENTEWISLDGRRVVPRTFPSMREASDFMRQHDDVEGFSIYGNRNFVAQYIAERFPKTIKFNKAWVNVFNIDIEVASPDGFPTPKEAAYPVISIALKSSLDKIFYVWGLQNCDLNKIDIPKGHTLRYRKASSEEDLLAQFVLFWKSQYPDAVTGWNIRFFDIPYLVNRIVRVHSEDMAKNLSPWGRIDYRQVEIMNKQEDTYDIVGISTLDYQEVFKKFGYYTYGPQESYSLDHIAHVVTGERKLSYKEHGSLHNLYERDFEKFISYNIRDVHLVDKIEAEAGFLDLVMTMAYRGGVNYSDALGTTAIWDSIIYRKLNPNKIAIPFSDSKTKPAYPGGYVKEPNKGKQEWIVSFDLNSLYPMTIVQYNMSPETLTDIGIYLPKDVDYYLEGKSIPQECYDKNVAVAANGTLYSKKFQGIVPTIIEDYYAERATIKKKMLERQKERESMTNAADKRQATHDINLLNTHQMAIKILMNSLYGALGNKHFRYFDVRIAEGITLSGQLAVRWAEKAMNREMNKLMKTEDVDYVVYIDTDSVYINFRPLVDATKPKDPVAFLDKTCAEFFEGVFERAYDRLFKYMNGYKNTMVMAREAIADAAIWTSKKRYIMNVHNSEGVQFAQPKIKIQGIEAVKSSTPQVVRTKFKEAYKIALEGNQKELQSYIENFRDEFCSLPPEEVSFPRGVSEIDKWMDASGTYKKGCPIHVRGAIIHNNMVQKTGAYADKIQNGSKVKFCYMKMPNPTMENVIAFTNFLPEEFKLGDYIDYDTQFDKTFIEPLRIISDSIGWQLEKTSTLEDFFG